MKFPYAIWLIRLFQFFFICFCLLLFKWTPSWDAFSLVAILALLIGGLSLSSNTIASIRTVTANSAIDMLEKAYEVLAEEFSEPIRGRRGGRANWLVAARLIHSSNLVSKALDCCFEKKKYLAMKDYWRSQMKKLVMFEDSQLAGEYFAHSAEQFLGRDSDGSRPLPLDERSSAVVWRFIQSWEIKGRALKGEHRFSFDEIQLMQSVGPSSLAQILTHQQWLISSGRDTIKPVRRWWEKGWIGAIVMCFRDFKLVQESVDVSRGCSKLCVSHFSVIG